VGSVLDALWAGTPVVSAASLGTQFTYVTGTKVQILTQKALLAPSSRLASSALVSADKAVTLARNLGDYDALARALIRRATNQTQRLDLRRRFAEARDSRLFDSSLWASNWERWLVAAVDVALVTSFTRDPSALLPEKRFHVIIS
jgi:hypothetical protein